MNPQNSDRDEHQYVPTDSADTRNSYLVQDVPVWNPRALHELEAIGGEPLVAKVARQCVTDAEGHLQSIVTCGTDSAWRESAHALHGVALNVGAVRLLNLLETMLAGREASAAEWAAPLAKELDDLRQVLTTRFP